jgi:hypothetical protein
MCSTSYNCPHNMHARHVALCSAGPLTGAAGTTRQACNTTHPYICLHKHNTHMHTPSVAARQHAMLSSIPSASAPAAAALSIVYTWQSGPSMMGVQLPGTLRRIMLPSAAWPPNNCRIACITVQQARCHAHQCSTPYCPTRGAAAALLNTGCIQHSPTTAKLAEKKQVPQQIGMHISPCMQNAAAVNTQLQLCWQMLGVIITSDSC